LTRDSKLIPCNMSSFSTSNPKIILWKTYGDLA